MGCNINFYDEYGYMYNVLMDIKYTQTMLSFSIYFHFINSFPINIIGFHE